MPFILACLLLLLYLVTAVHHARKPLPPGISARMPERPARSVQFFSDITFTDADGNRQSRQEIFDEVFRLISQARSLIVLDMFLFNAFQGVMPENHRRLCQPLVDLLIDRRQTEPGLRILLITDPFNTLYGGVPAPHLASLREAGVEVVTTDLRPLRDSNPVWSGFWRLCCQWFGNNAAGGWLPNPVGPGRVTLRTYLTLLNFKANHRKTLVVDEGRDWTALVTSANPHDASSAHDNVALRFSGPAALDLLATELAVARLSGMPLSAWPQPPAAGAAEEPPDARVQVLTESRIRDAVITAADSAGTGDRICIHMFFMAHRGILAAIKNARHRGAEVQVLLDPNKDAFGRTKGGIPNRQSAIELARADIHVRWADTRGEQSHSKVFLLLRHQGSAELILGSANFTRRNLDDFNLETDVRLVASATHPAIDAAKTNFELCWNNSPAIRFSVDHAHYADSRQLRYWRYRFMEATGWCIF